MTFRADIGPVDEDGFQVVIITNDVDYTERYSIRYDQVHQWVEQELTILDEMEKAQRAEDQHRAQVEELEQEAKQR